MTNRVASLPKVQFRKASAQDTKPNFIADYINSLEPELYNFFVTEAEKKGMFDSHPAMAIQDARKQYTNYNLTPKTRSVFKLNAEKPKAE